MLTYLTQCSSSNAVLISHNEGAVMLTYLTQCSSSNAVLISHNLGVVMQL